MGTQTTICRCLLVASLAVCLQVVSPAQVSTRPVSQPVSQPASRPNGLQQKRLHRQAWKWVTFLELSDRRADAAEQLLKMGRTAIPSLIRGLDDPRPVVVRNIAPGQPWVA